MISKGKSNYIKEGSANNRKANGHTEYGKALLSFSSQDVPHNHLLLALIDFTATKAQDISGQGKHTEALLGSSTKEV